MPLRVLILGGTTEASALARRLAGDARFEATLSLAGRTTAPRAQPIAVRTGGFGGSDGLARFLMEQSIAAVVDATHPFADQISLNAFVACALTTVPLALIVRPVWRQRAGDRWQSVSTIEAAVAGLGAAPRRVFLSLGRQDLKAFAAAPQHHYLARVIEPPELAALPPDLRIVQARGPFERADEIRLLIDEGIDVVVSKNSGGEATYAKIAAARELDLPVVMIARPEKPAGYTVDDVDGAMAWLQGYLHGSAPRSLRGV